MDFSWVVPFIKAGHANSAILAVVIYLLLRHIREKEKEANRTIEVRDQVFHDTLLKIVGVLTKQSSSVRSMADIMNLLARRTDNVSE